MNHKNGTTMEPIGNFQTIMKNEGLRLRAIDFALKMQLPQG